MTPRRAQTFLLGLFVGGSLGLGAELLLLDHYEEWPQLIPLVLMGLGTVAGSWFWASPRGLALRVFRGVGVLFLLGGMLGPVLHYRGNVEFELERVAALGGWRLFAEAMKGATPVLAPGALIGLGLIGLFVTYGYQEKGARR